MLKKLSVAALVAAMSVASVPAMISVAQAQGGANEPPTAPDPSDAMKGGDSSKGDHVEKRFDVVEVFDEKDEEAQDEASHVIFARNSGAKGPGAPALGLFLAPKG